MLTQLNPFPLSNDTYKVIFSNRVGRDNSGLQRLATGWTAQGSNPGGDEIFRTRPHQPWGPLIFRCSGYRFSLSGVKRPGCGVNDQPSSRSKVKERVELYLSSWSVLGCTLHFSLFFSKATLFLKFSVFVCFYNRECIFFSYACLMSPLLQLIDIE
jgi:hypothetical protein